MATWALAVSASGSSHDLEVETTHLIGFYGDNFGDTITVAEYQSSVHILEADSSDYCDNHPTNKVENIQYVDGSNGYHRAGTASGSLALNTIENTSLFRYHFNHASAVSTSGATYYAYDGTTPATPPVGVACWAFEVDDSSWSSASGSANALALDAQGSSTDHYFFIGVSAGPETVGSKTGWKLRLDLTYY